MFDLDKVYDKVHCSLVWWLMQKLSIDEWLVRAAQVTNRDYISNDYSIEYSVQREVHKRLTFRPRLFITVYQAIKEEFKIGCTQEFLHAEDLVQTRKEISSVEVRCGI